MSEPKREQQVMMISMPSEAQNERLTNARIREANKDGWTVTAMENHNGFLVFLLERAVSDG